MSKKETDPPEFRVVWEKEYSEVNSMEETGFDLDKMKLVQEDILDIEKLSGFQLFHDEEDGFRVLFRQLDLKDPDDYEKAGDELKNKIEKLVEKDVEGL